MNGTEKQINWANSIKAELLPILEKVLTIQLPTEDRGRRGGPGYSLEIQSIAKSAIEATISHTDAGDWIDWRNEPVKLVLIAKYGSLAAAEDISMSVTGNLFKIEKAISALINQARK